MGCAMPSIRRCARSDFSARVWKADCYDYGIRSSAKVLVEERLACRSGQLPDDLLRLGVEALAAASFRDGHRRPCGLVSCWFGLCQTVASKIWHAGLARGVSNGHSHRPLHRPALVLLSL